MSTEGPHFDPTREPIPPPPSLEPIVPAPLRDGQEEYIPQVLPVDREIIPQVLPVPYDYIPRVLPAPPRPPHPNIWWSLLWCKGIFWVQGFGAVGGIILFFLLTLLFSDPSGLVPPASRRSANPFDFSFMKDPGVAQWMSRLMLPAFAVTQVLFILYAVIALRLVAGRDAARKIALRRPSFVHLLLTLLSLPGMMLLAAALNILMKLFLVNVLGEPEEGGLEFVVKIFNEWPWPVAVLIIGAGAAIAEELMFRGFLGRGLVGHYGWVWGIVLTSMLFGIIHVIPQQVIYAGFLGLLLHFVYVTTRSLWMPMLLHFLNNSISVLLMRAPEWVVLEDPLARPGALTAWLCWFAGAQVLLAAVCWALYQSRVRLEPGDNPELPAWKPDYPGVELPPPDTNTRVVRPWPNLLSAGLVLAALWVFGSLIWRGWTLL